MKEYKRDELRPGMRFDKPLYLPDGNLIVQAGVKLTDEDLARMEKWGIDKIQTEGELIESGEPALAPAPAPAAPAAAAAASAAAPAPATAATAAPAAAADPYTEERARLAHLRRMNELQVLAQKKREVIALYSAKLEEARQVIEGLSIGVPLEQRKVDDLVGPLVSEVPKYKNIFIGCALQKSGAGEYLFSHSVNVCVFALVIGTGFEYSKSALHELAVGAILHDVGMLKVPKHIREKKRKLEESEYNLIKTHPIHGYRILTKYKFFSAGIQGAVLQHHESFDGSGYPQKMSGEGIAEFARIISVSDVFDALTKKRSWRDERKGYDAMRNILQESSSKFDPRALRTFLSNMAIYPIGSVVQLNTKEYAIVVDANEKTPLRPTVKVLFDEEKRRLLETKIVDLMTVPSLMIVKGVDREEIDISVVDEL